MSTPKQVQASRANGAKSKGPVTAQGKQNSSRNSIRHGLLAETVVLEAEKTGAFLELLRELYEEHQPQTPTELMLVDTLATARWRQDRIWGMQKVAFDHDVASSISETDSNPLRAVMALRNSPDNIRTHELLLRYEIAFDRQISRALLRLQQLQERRERRASGTSKSAEQPIAPVPPSRELERDELEERRENVASTASTPVKSPKSAPAKRTRQPIEKANRPFPSSVPTTNPNSANKQRPASLAATSHKVPRGGKKAAA